MTLYQLKATKNGATVSLSFANADIYFDTARALRREGYEVDAPMHGYILHKTVEDALATAAVACRAAA